MSEKSAISDAEWQVMNVIWDRSPISAADVIAALESRVDWSPATVKTLLHRLTKKGALRTRPQGRGYLYEPAVSREACVRKASRTFLATVFDGDAVPFLEYFVRDAKLSRGDIARLKQLLDEESKPNG